MNAPPLEYLGLLALTLFVEGAVVLVLAPRGERRTWLAACAAVNLSSHPLAHLIGAGGLGAWFALEVGVTAVEAAAFRCALSTRWSRAIPIAALANGATASLALAMA